MHYLARAKSQARVANARPSVGLRVLRRLGQLDWIRYGIRERTLRRFCNPDTTPGTPFNVAFFGQKYTGSLDNFLDWCVFFYGAYERQELFLLRDLARQRAAPVFVDIGANVGQHTLFMAPYCSQVHAFEPYAPVRERLEHKIRVNGCSNVVVHPVGIGSREQMLTYFAPSGANRGTGSFVPAHAPANNVAGDQLPIVAGDAYLMKLELDRIDVMKIDVEGFEREVVAGLSAVLRRYRPAVLMEFSPTTRESFSDRDDFLAMVPAGYSVRSIESNRPSAIVFNRPGYVFRDFDFDGRRGNVVLLPDEMTVPA